MEKKQGEYSNVDGTFVNVDEVREDFIQEVYRVLDADSTNDRANQIIDAFDNLSTVKIEKCSEQKSTEWKPSKEMLEALYRVIPENMMEISEDEILLDKLYQGLKYGRVIL